MPIIWWLDKQDAACTSHGILLANEKGRVPIARILMDPKLSCRVREAGDSRPHSARLHRTAMPMAGEGNGYRFHSGVMSAL